MAGDGKVNITRTGGIGFGGLLTIVLVILKVFGHINCSWWLVFAPVIFTTTLSIVLILLLLMAVILANR